MQICFKTKGPDLIVNSLYAPHSGVTFKVREIWYQECTQLLLKNNGKMQLSLGDFNARFHAKTINDSQICNFVVGRGNTFLSNIYQPETTNRELLNETLMATDSYVMNTFFKKDPSKLVTYRENQRNYTEEWTPQQYAQIDFVIANSKVRNAVKDVYSDAITELDSDHFPVITELKIKLHHCSRAAGFQKLIFRFVNTGRQGPHTHLPYYKKK